MWLLCVSNIADGTGIYLSVYSNTGVWRGTCKCNSSLGTQIFDETEVLFQGSKWWPPRVCNSCINWPNPLEWRNLYVTKKPHLWHIIKHLLFSHFIKDTNDIWYLGEALIGFPVCHISLASCKNGWIASVWR